jgi:phosphoribosylanthranilate isomerase
MPIPAGRSIWCKICGITTKTDAKAAQTAGADALGMNCYQGSPRYVELSTLADICGDVTATRVALFVNPERAQVEQVLAAADVDLLQFHGDEDEPFCAGFGLPYIKALRMSENLDVPATAARFESAWALLLDAFVPGQLGGTGTSFDWDLWPRGLDCRLIVAGGLTVANVGQAITELQPFGVDVCGGVEGSQKGVKNHQKINAFMQEVRRVRRN